MTLQQQWNEFKRTHPARVRTVPPVKRPARMRQMPMRIPLINENNFVDLASANYACDTTGTVTLIATIPNGNTQNTRIGKKAYYKSITVRGQFTPGTMATLNNVTALLIYDKRPTGALPAVTDILTAASPQSFMNDANAGRFKILKRWDEFLIGNSMTPTVGQEIKDADAYIKIKDLPIVFKAAGTGAIADIEEGAIYLVTVGGNVAGTTAVNLTATFRTRFHE